MNDTLPAVKQFLKQSGYPFEIWPCDPELADTARYCEHYGVPLENSVNAILVRSKTGEKKFALCVLRATDRLNGNHTVRKKLGARKVSFASAEETRELTGMEIGGVTPFCLPEGLPIWIDSAVMGCEYVVLGGGNRSCKIKVSPQAIALQVNIEVIDDLALSVAVQT